ncbi:antibiotic biosynthesis monooxygenase family protein [Streptomyces sp. NPDC051572]|uniref:putative quinol monooxygenase n=1 Tax=unclassified Streptomyces TaxID=2593676 RepID=UPI00344B272E
MEIANVLAREGTADELAVNYQKAMEVVLRHPGASRAQVLRQQENPRAFAIVIEWESVAAHDDFRGSDLLLAFRACLDGAVEQMVIGGHYDVCALAE